MRGAGLGPGEMDGESCSSAPKEFIATLRDLLWTMEIVAVGDWRGVWPSLY